MTRLKPAFLLADLLAASLVLAGIGTGCSREQTFAETPKKETQPAEGASQAQSNVYPESQVPVEMQTQDQSGESTEQGNNADRQSFALPDVEALILSVPRDRDFFKINEVSVPPLNCGETLPLYTSFPGMDEPPAEEAITWQSSDPEVARVDDQGLITVTGFGDVLIVAQTQRNDGSPVQDHIRLSVAGPANNFSVSTPSPIRPTVTAAATLNGTTYTDVVNGRAEGVVQLTHPQRNIAIHHVQSVVASSDFISFTFDPIETPVKDPATCLWNARFGIAFEYLFVGDATRYTQQRLSVTFAEATGRPPLDFNWNATLFPGSQPPGENPMVVNTGVGTQGFSPLRPAGSP